MRHRNQDLNRLPNAQIFPCNMKPSSKRLLLYLSPTPLSCWCGKAPKWKAVVSQKIFWRPWQNGWVSITVMRLQEWPPRFPHLRHLSPRLLRGIHSFLCNSLLSLLLLPLLCSLLSFPFYYPRNLQEVCTFVRVHEGGMFHMRSLRLMRHAGMCPATRPSYTAWTRGVHKNGPWNIFLFFFGCLNSPIC